jgi:uncharacterized protein YbbC (DUF1343 family)
VIPLDNWRRGTTYGELGWFWVPPSPHIPRWETCYYYAMTGILGELGKVSEGVGTPIPFEQVGAPWLDGNALAEDMNSRRLKGVKFRPASFTPRYGSFADKECHGVQIYITDYDRVVPAAVSRELMTAMNRVAGDQAIFSGIDLTGEPSLFLKALGDRGMAKALKKGEAVEPMLDRIQTERDGFLKRRQQYLIYK